MIISNKSVKVFALVLILLSAASRAVRASTIDVTSQCEYTLVHGATLMVEFNAASYAHNNPGTSPNPTGLNLQVLGLDLAGSPTSFIPNTVQSYYKDFELAGSLMSEDGSVSVPLIDSGAAQLGFGVGTLLVLPSTYWGANGQQSVSMIGGSVQLDPSLAALLFGPNVANSTGLACIQLVNRGNTITVGLGSGSTLRAALSVPGLTGSGDVSTSGVTRHVLADGGPFITPEPATIALLGTGAGLLLLWGFFRQKQRSTRER